MEENKTLRRPMQMLLLANDERKYKLRSNKMQKSELDAANKHWTWYSPMTAVQIPYNNEN